MKKIRILIADDLDVFRSGLRMLLNRQKDMRVVGEAADGNEVVRKARTLNPTVVLMELAMPETGRMKTILETVRACPDARVLVLTIYDDPAWARAALAAGATGYVAKNVSKPELLAAVRAVHRRRTFDLMQIIRIGNLHISQMNEPVACPALKDVDAPQEIHDESAGRMLEHPSGLAACSMRPSLRITTRSETSNASS